jgi:hypothetical protein
MRMWYRYIYLCLVDAPSVYGEFTLYNEDMFVYTQTSNHWDIYTQGNLKLLYLEYLFIDLFII